MGIIEWSPDSCQCIIHIKMPQETLDKVIQVCHIHKDKKGKKLFDAIFSHNKKFCSIEMIDKRRKEYHRIQSLGNSTKNCD